MGKRIGIFGAGWSGVPLAQHLKQQGHVVELITRQTLSGFKAYGDLLISTWPKEALSSLLSLPQSIPLIAMSSVRESAEIVAFETALKMRFSQLTILRLGGLIGYNRHPGKFLSGKKNLPGKNHCTNLLHRDDLIQIVSGFVERPTLGIFNLVCDDHPTRGEFYTKAAATLNLPLPHFDPQDESSQTPLSNHAMKQALNYTFLYASPYDYLQVLRERKNYDT